MGASVLYMLFGVWGGGFGWQQRGAPICCGASYVARAFMLEGLVCWRTGILGALYAEECTVCWGPHMLRNAPYAGGRTPSSHGRHHLLAGTATYAGGDHMRAAPSAGRGIFMVAVASHAGDIGMLTACCEIGLRLHVADAYERHDPGLEMGE